MPVFAEAMPQQMNSGVILSPGAVVGGILHSLHERAAGIGAAGLVLVLAGCGVGGSSASSSGEKEVTMPSTIACGSSFHGKVNNGSETTLLGSKGQRLVTVKVQENAGGHIDPDPQGVARGVRIEPVEGSQNAVTITAGPTEFRFKETNVDSDGNTLLQHLIADFTSTCG